MLSRPLPHIIVSKRREKGKGRWYQHSWWYFIYPHILLTQLKNKKKNGRRDTKHLQTQIFFLHFIRDKKTASEDSHPFYREISGINTHKKKEKKNWKYFYSYLVEL